jgi:hypothetical protein
MRVGRSYFNPCEWNGLLYLCGKGSTIIETFNIDTSTFQVQKARLPERNSSCCVFIESGDLVVLSNRYMTRWSLGEARVLTQLAETQHPKIEMWCVMSPLLDAAQGVIYYTSRKGCFRVKIDGSDWQLIVK